MSLSARVLILRDGLRARRGESDLAACIAHEPHLGIARHIGPVAHALEYRSTSLELEARPIHFDDGARTREWEDRHLVLSGLDQASFTRSKPDDA